MTTTTTTALTGEIVDGLTQLPHSGLRVPHTRLHVTSYRGIETGRGVAFTATLRLGNIPVGTIENPGNGGATWLDFHDHRAYGPAQFNEFVAACRYDSGRDVGEEDVLTDLTTEYEIGQAIKRAEAGVNKRAVMRWMEFIHNADGPVGEPFPNDFRTCNKALALMFRDVLVKQMQGQVLSDYGWWELWTGERWERLTKPVVGAANS